MEGAFNTAYKALSSMSRDELRRLQSRISDLLGEKDEDLFDLFQPRSDAEWELELDSAISEFDAGKGYDAKRMCQTVRERFGWTEA